MRRVVLWTQPLLQRASPASTAASAGLRFSGSSSSSSGPHGGDARLPQDSAAALGGSRPAFVPPPAASLGSFVTGATGAAEPPVRPEVQPLRPSAAAMPAAPQTRIPATAPHSDDTHCRSPSELPAPCGLPQAHNAAGAPHALRNMNLDTVLRGVTPHSHVFSRQEFASSFSFIGYNNASAASVAARLLALPAEHRTIHALVGRNGIPCDFYGDIDMGISVVNPEGRLEEALAAVERQLTLRGFRDLQFVVLTGNATDKHSFHVHVHSPLMAFNDFRDVLELARQINDELPEPLFDMGVYRANATLRVAYAVKAGQPTRMLTPFHTAARHPALRARLAAMAEMTQVEVLVRSFAVRAELRGTAARAAEREAKFGSSSSSSSSIESATSAGMSDGMTAEAASFNGPRADAKRRKQAALEPRTGIVKLFNARAFRNSACADELQRGAVQTANGTFKAVKNGRTISLVPDESGRNLVPQCLSPETKWKRYREVRKKVLAMPDAYARDYDTWAHVGLALHSFCSGGEREPLEDFVAFSAMCPFKFDRKVVEKKWAGFGVKCTQRTTRREEDVFTWRRGYNYLNKTIWRK